MPVAHAQSGPALAAYEALAPHYDRFTAGYDHERWLGRIEAIACAQGLAGRRVLDVACGTGKSFLPLLERGYRVTACDMSPAMVRLASRRAGGRATVFVADMRRLPALSPFDLVTCLDDALNYLLDASELAAAFTGIRRALAPDGLFVFDVNTLATYRNAYCSSFEAQVDGLDFHWRGRPRPVRRGGLFEAELAVLSEGREIGVSRHLQRHHSAGTIRAALAHSGLEPVAVYGQLAGATLEQHAQESRHSKVLWIVHASRALQSSPEGRIQHDHAALVS